MSWLNIQPWAVTDAAQGLQNIGTQLEEAVAQASAPTLGAAIPAAADEVSAMIAELFGTHGAQFQQVAGIAAQFQNQFINTLTQAAATYQATEQAGMQALRDVVTEIERPIIGPIVQTYFDSVYGVIPKGPQPFPVPTNSSVALLMGGTGLPFLGTNTINQVMNLYMPSGSIAAPIWTPEQWWPLTPWVGGLTINQSMAQGLALFDSALRTELAAGNNVTVFGPSQGAAIATMEIRNLMAQGSPFVNQLSFVLEGNPNQPNGGIFERLVGAYIPLMDAYGNGVTPPNSPYHTIMYQNQYDGVAHFPRYPLNVVSDANAFMGFMLGAHDYVDFPSTAGNIQLPTSPGYTGNTTYYFRLTQDLPLVQPLRTIPFLSNVIPGLNPFQQFTNAVADLIQPDLRVLVDMGYGSYEYADIPTPASLISIPNPAAIIPALINGAIQGPQAFAVDMGWLPPSMMPHGYPFNPVLNPGLNFDLPQSPVTGLSMLLGLEGAITRPLFGG